MIRKTIITVLATGIAVTGLAAGTAQAREEKVNSFSYGPGYKGRGEAQRACRAAAKAYEGRAKARCRRSSGKFDLMVDFDKPGRPQRPSTGSGSGS